MYLLFLKYVVLVSDVSNWLAVALFCIRPAACGTGSCPIHASKCARRNHYTLQCLCNSSCNKSTFYSKQLEYMKQLAAEVLRESAATSISTQLMEEIGCTSCGKVSR